MGGQLYQYNNNKYPSVTLTRRASNPNDINNYRTCVQVCMHMYVSNFTLCPGTYANILAMRCYALLCYAVLPYSTLCHAMLCHDMPCSDMLCFAMLCYAMLCYAMLCY